MRVIHTAAEVDREASGLSKVILELCQELSNQDVDVTLMTMANLPEGRHFAFEHQSFPKLVGPRRLGASLGMWHALRVAAKDADVVHTHSLWRMVNVFPAWAAAKAGRPLIVSPHGTLMPVARHYARWTKLMFWFALQRRAVSLASCLHATSELEYQWFRRLGLNQPVAVIPAGVSVPACPPICDESRYRRLLYLGRVHPIKGLDNLIDAWADLSKKYAHWELRIVGPGDPVYLGTLMGRCRDAKIPRVMFAGPSYGESKIGEYASADLCILPSSSENFGLTVAESLAAGTPVIATTGSPWSGLAGKQCGWQTSPDPEGLRAALEIALAMDRDALKEMGANGRNWMTEEYSWAKAAAEMKRVYYWMALGGPAPASIRLV